LKIIASRRELYKSRPEDKEERSIESSSQPQKREIITTVRLTPFSPSPLLEISFNDHWGKRIETETVPIFL